MVRTFLGFEGLEEVEAVGKGVVEGGEGGIEVGP